MRLKNRSTKVFAGDRARRRREKVPLRFALGGMFAQALRSARLGADGVAVVALVGEQDVALAEGVEQGFRLPCSQQPDRRSGAM